MPETSPHPKVAAVASPSPRRRRFNIPWHPWLFALFPILSLYTANRHEVMPPDMLRPALASVALTGMLWLGLWGVLRRDTARSAVLTSLFVFWLFTFGHLEDLKPVVVDYLAFLLPNAYDLTPTAFALALWAAGAVLLGAVAVFVRRDYTPTSRILNAAGAALVAAALAPLAQDAVLTRITRPPAASPSQSPAEAAENAPWGNWQPAQAPTAAAPDVYFIVLDAYGRSDVLQRYYGYDNGPFLDALRKRGFFVPRRSRANYDQTIQCLAAALGMCYNDDIAARQPPGSGDATPLCHRIDRSPAAAFLRARGYRYIGVSTGFPMTKAYSADLLLQGDPRDNQTTTLTPFEGLVIAMTPLGAMPRVSGSLYDKHRTLLDAAWRTLAALPRLQPERKFVFAHILAPHPPFVFGPNGEPVPQGRRAFSLADGAPYVRSSSKEAYRRGYVDQLQYVNKRTLAALDGILAGSAVRPIIVLIGDHGPRMELDGDRLDRSDVRECYSNLMAISLPDAAATPALFGDDVTPVNAFRLIFSHCFGADLPRLPDRSYFPAPSLYHYTDITDRLTVAAPGP